MKKDAALFIALIASVFASPGVTDWQSLEPMPTPRSELSAELIDGRIYVPGGLGGLRTFEAYSLVTDRWETLADLPAARHHLMTVSYQGKLYVFGGANEKWQPVDSAWEYEADTARWRSLRAMPEPRSAGAAVTLGNFIYVVGGVGPSGRTLRYEPGQDRWKLLKSTLQRREHIAAVVTEGKIVVIGGRFQGSGEFASSEIYEPTNDEWHRGPSINTARGGHDAAIYRGSLIVFGGEIIMQKYKKTLRDSERLDHLSGKWRKGPNLPLPLHGLSAVSHEQDLYILGGSRRAGAIVNRGQLYRYSEPVASE